MHLQAGTASCRLPVSWEDTRTDLGWCKGAAHIISISYQVCSRLNFSYINSWWSALTYLPSSSFSTVARAVFSNNPALPRTGCQGCSQNIKALLHASLNSSMFHEASTSKRCILSLFRCRQLCHAAKCCKHVSTHLGSLERPEALSSPCHPSYKRVLSEGCACQPAKLCKENVTILCLLAYWAEQQ